MKRSQSGMIADPITLPPDATLQQAEDIMATYRISGVPIVDKDNRLVGILTNRDIRFVEPADFGLPVSQFMTPQPLVTAPVGISREDAKALLQKHRIEKLPLVDNKGCLKGLLTVKDIQKERDYPNSALDGRGRLLCGAALGVGADLERRAGLLVDAGVDVIAIDTAHGHTKGVLAAIRRVRKNWQSLPIIAGNVVLESVDYVIPLRPHVHAAFCVYTYAGRLRVLMHFDPRAIDDDKARELLDTYLQQVRQTIETSVPRA